MKCTFALTALAVASRALAKSAYDGTKVFRVKIADNTQEVDNIISKLSLETWRPNVDGMSADVVVPASKLSKWKSMAASLNTETMHEDLGVSIEEESTFQAYAGDVSASWFNSYHSFNDHLDFLQDLQDQFPSNSRIVSSGLSYEGRNITGIHFYGSSGGGKKPAVVFHGTVHAREWITTMTVEYIAYQLLNGLSSDPQVETFLSRYDFYVFPFVNPDGFVFTNSGSNNRLWRKNRQPNTGNSCVGRDINRNWNYQWNVAGGASDNPCDEDYRGKAAADAPETKALAAFLLKVKNSQGLKLYMDFHSYSQLLMSPYGYACNAVSSKASQYASLTKGATTALKQVHGTSYEYGPICQTIYPASGGSIDYTEDVTKADYSLAIELRDTGRYGFVLPPAQIVPTGEETYAAIKYLLTNIK